MPRENQLQSDSWPDCISPIIGFRSWQWDRAGIRSLNGKRWQPGTPLEAGCTVCDFAVGRRGPKAGQRSHSAPQLDCTCGIYANKRLEHLRRPSYERLIIHGEVLLWGMVVEHQYGWRAQYAYPKSFLLPTKVLPVTVKEIEVRLENLISYDRDIIILDDGATLPLWKSDSGFAACGLEYVMGRASKWYTQRNQMRDQAGRPSCDCWARHCCG